MEDKDERLAHIRDNYDKGVDAMNGAWERMRDNMSFAYKDNGQWPEDLRKERNKDDRPCLTINRIPAFIRQVIGDQRLNQIKIKVDPIDSGTDIETAEIIEGLIRNIEQQSRAKIAYDTALHNSVSGGLGYITVRTEYARRDMFDQDICIKRVFNPYSIILDPSSTEPDGSDAMWGFEMEWIRNEEFDRRFPDKERIDFENSNRYGWWGDWYNKEEVLVASYWERELIKKTLVKLSDGRTLFEDDIDNLSPDVTVINERKVDTYKVSHEVVSGADILVEEEEWAGQYIPIVPVYGEEVYLEGKRYLNSIFQYAKESQQMYNYWRSAATESVALTPKAPYIATPEQIEGYGDEWAQANIKNYSILYYNPTHDAPPPQRQMPPVTPVGILNEANAAIDDIKATIGMYDASLGAQGNESSGKAILARQREGDTATYIWPDNLKTSIAQVGRIIVDLIPKIYNTERVIRVIGGNEEAKTVDINKPVLNDNNEPVILNDLTVGKYDVFIEAGPSHNTQRQQAADNLAQILQGNPQLLQTAGDILFKNMDGPGMSEVAERLRKTLPPGLVEPEEGEELPQEEDQGPDPQLMLEIKKLELEAEKLEVERMKVEQEGVSLDERMRKIVLNTLEEMETGE